jgi:hypothetical protein
VEEEKGYEVVVSEKNNLAVYCIKDGEWCMLTVNENFKEGSIWLELPDLEQVIKNLLKVRRQLKND